MSPQNCFLRHVILDTVGIHRTVGEIYRTQSRGEIPDWYGLSIDYVWINHPLFFEPCGYSLCKYEYVLPLSTDCLAHILIYTYTSIKFVSHFSSAFLRHSVSEFLQRKTRSKSLLRVQRGVCALGKQRLCICIPCCDTYLLTYCIFHVPSFFSPYLTASGLGEESGNGTQFSWRIILRNTVGRSSLW